ncbi:sialate O-acetylesterase [Candidatus Enterococcus ferrettii]|uniref:Sialate O-acetylesterase domain-containing protein n=1 Tax=Candidatus Enterococcus ferrettii TaxID=2815324 RepID=A0ABV0EWH1_9ENTE|nr:sialate O-acetylesterase [Enterococcus sp. 665A]MBO1342369.1 sialate O-acetylesterase [Enterococcus sp. 665A]
MKSILLIGQSNMAGRGFIEEVTPIYHEHIQMLRNGRWQMMAEPIHFDREVAGVGPAASFALEWVNQHPDEELGLIPCAEGGSTIDEWALDSSLTRHAISEAKFALENSELVGILWHQGESDSLNQLYRTYAPKLKALFDYLRQELNAPEIPIVIGGLGDYLGKNGFGASAVEYKEINQLLKQAADQEDNCYFVTAKGLTPNPDGIHLNAVSQRKFGLRYYQAFSRKQSVFEALPNEEELMQQLQTSATVTIQMYLLSKEFVLGRISQKEFVQTAGELMRDE